MSVRRRTGAAALYRRADRHAVIGAHADPRRCSLLFMPIMPELAAESVRGAFVGVGLCFFISVGIALIYVARKDARRGEQVRADEDPPP